MAGSDFVCPQCQRAYFRTHPVLDTRVFCSHECQLGSRTAISAAAKRRNVEGFRTAKSFKNYLLRTRKNACEICGVSDWNKKPLTLHMDHVDGNPDNNSLSNLRLICPNCHSQTDTYTNKKKGRSSLKMDSRNVWRRSVYRNGAGGRNRTDDLRITNSALLPTELHQRIDCTETAQTLDRDSDS